MSHSALIVSLTAPNNRTFDQPLGLFIDNEWVPAKSGDLIKTTSPLYVPPPTVCAILISQGNPNLLSPNCHPKATRRR